MKIRVTEGLKNSFTVLNNFQIKTDSSKMFNSKGKSKRISNFLYVSFDYYFQCAACCKNLIINNIKKKLLVFTPIESLKNQFLAIKYTI